MIQKQKIESTEILTYLQPSHWFWKGQVQKESQGQAETWSFQAIGRRNHVWGQWLSHGLVFAHAGWASHLWLTTMVFLQDPFTQNRKQHTFKNKPTSRTKQPKLIKNKQTKNYETQLEEMTHTSSAHLLPKRTHFSKTNTPIQQQHWTQMKEEEGSLRFNNKAQASKIRTAHETWTQKLLSETNRSILF